MIHKYLYEQEMEMKNIEETKDFIYEQKLISYLPQLISSIIFHDCVGEAWFNDNFLAMLLSLDSFLPSFLLHLSSIISASTISPPLQEMQTLKPNLNRGAFVFFFFLLSIVVNKNSPFDIHICLSGTKCSTDTRCLVIRCFMEWGVGL